MKFHLKHFRVPQGKRLDLHERSTAIDPFYTSKKDYKKLLAEHVEKLSSLQQIHYARNKYAVLLIFQAMDAAGKDGAIRHVMSGVNPQGCQVFSFKHPSAAELEHDLLWRTTRDLPQRGRIGLFNRSYYEEVLVVRVHRHLLQRQQGPTSNGTCTPMAPDCEILSPPLERGTAPEIPFAHRRARQELEVQHGRHQGAEVLEAVPLRV